MIDRYGVFTALEEDVCELGVMSKFFTGMKMIIASVPRRAIFIKRVHKESGKIIGQIGHECSTFILLDLLLRNLRQKLKSIKS